MTFLAMSSQRSLFMLQKSQLEFEKNLIMNQTIWLTQEMDARAELLQGENPGSYDLDNDAYYVSLQKQEEHLQTQMQSLDDQIAILGDFVSSSKSAINTNLKNSCGLNLIGG